MCLSMCIWLYVIACLDILTPHMCESMRVRFGMTLRKKQTMIHHPSERGDSPGVSPDSQLFPAKIPPPIVCSSSSPTGVPHSFSSYNLPPSFLFLGFILSLLTFDLMLPLTQEAGRSNSECASGQKKSLHKCVQMHYE